jgi:hypothetical protein
MKKFSFAVTFLSWDREGSAKQAPQFGNDNAKGWHADTQIGLAGWLVLLVSSLYGNPRAWTNAYSLVSFVCGGHAMNVTMANKRQQRTIKRSNLPVRSHTWLLRCNNSLVE